MPWDKYATRELREWATAVGESWSSGDYDEALDALRQVQQVAAQIRAAVESDRQLEQRFPRR